jgi:hemerythrin superfamily protein
MNAMDAILALVDQHRAIESLFDEMARETRRRVRDSLVSRLAEELIAHLIAEEAVFDPASRDAGGSGRPAWSKAGPTADAGDPRRDGHLLLRIGLRRVLERRAGDASFDERIETLRLLFEEHAFDQEAVVFPRLMGGVSEAEREALGAEILASRPPVWVVTTEGRERVHSASAEWSARSQVRLP